MNYFHAERQPGETIDQYHARMKETKRRIDAHLKGRLAWNSNQRNGRKSGTFVHPTLLQKERY